MPYNNIIGIQNEKIQFFFFLGIYIVHTIERTVSIKNDFYSRNRWTCLESTKNITFSIRSNFKTIQNTLIIYPWSFKLTVNSERWLTEKQLCLPLKVKAKFMMTGFVSSDTLSTLSLLLVMNSVNGLNLPTRFEWKRGWRPLAVEANIKWGHWGWLKRDTVLRHISAPFHCYREGSLSPVWHKRSCSYPNYK